MGGGCRRCDVILRARQMRNRSIDPQPGQSDLADHAGSLARAGFTLIERQAASSSAAHATALPICREAAGLDPWPNPSPPLQVVGEFVIPADSAQARDFQVFHFDFGLPLDPREPRDLAHYTVLFVLDDSARPQAVTRLVNLRLLLAQRPWPDEEELARRFAEYGRSHGAWNSSSGYSEGILGRLVEAAHGRAPALPSVSANADFLCGTEFAGVDDERQFLAEHGLDLGRAVTEVKLEPGQMMIFDNLQIAHGRLGRRQARELHQLVLGYRALDTAGQLQVRKRILGAFTANGRA
jgi:hypothetical protein